MLIVLHASVHLSRGSLLGGVATELLGGLGLDGALRALDGGGTGNGGLEEVGAVTGLADLAGDSLVGPIRGSHHVSNSSALLSVLQVSLSGSTDLRAVLLAPKATV